MKLLHRSDLFAWSRFDEARNIDFHSVLWRRAAGNVVVDPLPLSPHERTRLAELGGVACIVITNSDHVRGAAELARETGATLCGPAGERAAFPIRCDRWLSDGESVVPGLFALELGGSKTSGELALLLEGATLITGDLVRGHQGGALNLLPEAKLKDPALALEAVRRLAQLEGVEAVLPGDGWPVFQQGHAALQALLQRLNRHA